jgi:diadenosine tetraphosphatase ApaH/serine/threonine PP2A family protein phosphatase
MPTVRGNEDRILLDDPRRHPDSPSLAFCRSQLAPEHLRWLAELPFSAVHEADFFLCHASPQADDAYLLWEMDADGARRRPAAAVAERLAGTAQPVVLCGHDHLSARLDLPGGRIVIDPGSVGLPAYRDDHPFPHAMEAGSPRARYAVVRRSPAGWQAEFAAVTYDHESAAATAERNGRRDWAHALRTGFAARQALPVQ